MLRYIDPNSTPPGNGFPYKQPENGIVLRGTSLSNLRRQVKAHRVANGIPIGININAEIEDISCRELLKDHPGYNGCEDDNGKIISSRSISLADVMQWAHTMADWAKQGFGFVPKEQAEARAEVCSRCPKNIEVAGCWSCKGVSKLIPLIKGDRTTSYDAKLESCGACSCVLKALVHIPIKALAKTHSDDLPYWENCWVPKEKREITDSP